MGTRWKRKKRKPTKKSRMMRQFIQPSPENTTAGLQYLRDNIFPEGPVALDCEMVGVGVDCRSALARVSIVAHDGSVLYDVISRPEEIITDYRTRWSGIRPSDMQRAIPFESVREQVMRIIEVRRMSCRFIGNGFANLLGKPSLLQNRIVVGHSLKNDFEVLKIEHPKDKIRDVSSSPHAKARARISTKGPPALRHLAYVLLGLRIQRKEHNSIEDAQATMAIYQLVEREWEAELKKKAAKRMLSTKRSAVEGNTEEMRSPSASTLEIDNSKLLSDDEYWTAAEDNDSPV
ncbi:unnamed protein product [Hydatigera taeniaeformis]|uniref:RNA exonuclease 4 n=1 Tax=Hydatigena taeniaeformis TaxID=6205 RepID=A0A0R3X4J3_HYDTA|nr:unnamed protein product [Hydatigera taeniaeformis]